MASEVGTTFRHCKWGPCTFLRVEGADWIVRVDSSNVLLRVRPEHRVQFEIIQEKHTPTPEPPDASTPSLRSSPQSRRARRAIESLRVGLPSLDGTTRRLAVGFRDTEKLMQAFLRDVEQGGGAMVLKGEYGQGKTFSLIVLEELATEAGFITARTEIDATENRLNKPHHIYRDLMSKLRVPNETCPGTRALVAKTVDLLARNGLRDAATREAWLMEQLGCFPLAWLLSDPEVTRKPHLNGILECDPNYPAGWARMYHCNPPQARYWPAFNAGTQGDFASYVLSGVGRLARLLGYKGFLIILDEMEKWSELKWTEQCRAGNLLGGLIWGATAEEGRRRRSDHPSMLEHSQRCGGYPFTTKERACTGVAIAMTPRGHEEDPEGEWCKYGTILVDSVPRFTRTEMTKYARGVVPLFAEAYGLALPDKSELATITDHALDTWKQHGDLTTRSGVQSVITAFDAWRDRR
jgi:hypothetical protein